MKKIQQLKAKKGFTLVELIIVIAIIGVLLALAVPALTTSDRPSAGKGYAKDFYYAAQTYASRRRLSDDPADNPIAAGSYMILYAEVVAGEKGQLTDATCGIAVSGTGQTAISAITDAKEKSFAEGFMRLMNERLTETNYDGTFYVMIDDQYRVAAAYWTDGDWSEVDGQSFRDNCILNSGMYACSFPTEYCTPVDAAGETMFNVT